MESVSKYTGRLNPKRENRKENGSIFVLLNNPKRGCNEK
jgi:hypothetical protein